MIGCFASGIKAPKRYISDKRHKYEIKNVLSPIECQVKHCRLSESCKYFAYIPLDKVCYLKNETALNAVNHENGVIFGTKSCIGKNHTF